MRLIEALRSGRSLTPRHPFRHLLIVAQTNALADSAPQAFRPVEGSLDSPAAGRMAGG